MRHAKDHRKLGRTASHRKAMLSNMIASLFLNEKRQVVTTLAKAKEARRWAEKMITFGKKGDVAARRQVYRFIPRRDVIKTLFDDIAPTFENRNGGYTRVIKLGPRKGDGAEMAILQLVGFEDVALEIQQGELERKAERKKKRQEQEEAELAEMAAAAETAEAPVESEKEEQK